MGYIGKKPTDAPLTSSDVADGIISNSKLAQDIISGQTALAVAPADTDEFLISDAGTLKRLDASLIGGGAWTFLQTVTASDDASVTIGSSSLFSSTYAVYKIFFNGVVPATDSQTGNIRVSIGGAVKTDAYYTRVSMRTYSGGTGWSNTVSESSTQLDRFFGTSVGSSTGESTNSEVTIYNPASTGKYKLITTHGANVDASKSATMNIDIGFYNNSTAAVDGIQFYFNSGNVASGTFRLYGLSKS